MHAISGLRKCLFSFRIAYAQYRYAPKWDTNEEELMDDKEILHRITELVNEEHELMSLAEGEGLDDEQRTRVKELEVHLDQCWDLLRQRRARRQAGLNPDEAKVRDEVIVEHYQQESVKSTRRSRCAGDDYCCTASFSNLCRSLHAPTGSWCPKCLSAGIRAGQSGYDLQRD